MMRTLARLAALVLAILIVTGTLFYRYPLWFLERPIYYHLWRAHVTGKYVSISNGNRLHFYEAGPENGTPLLLIHGLGSRGEDWAKLIPSFATAGFHVYAPDLLGYGRSSHPDVTYSIALEESTIEEFLQAVHQPQADVIGWSMGGWIAMRFTLDHPTMVNRLAVYDSVGTYYPAILPPGLFTPQDVEGVQRLVDVLEPTHRTVPAFIAKNSLRSLQANAWVVNQSLASMTGGRYLLDFRLQNLRQPMLITWGGADHLVPPSVGEALHRAVPQSVYRVVEGCGHLAPAECPGPFAEETLRFLRAQPPLAPTEKTIPQPVR